MEIPQPQNGNLKKGHIAVIACLMLLAAAAEFAMGRRVWGVSGTPGIWSGDTWSAHNSQFLFDPYTLTHLTHGVLFYGILSILLRKWRLSLRMVLAIAFESGWEILENTNFIIER